MRPARPRRTPALLAATAVAGAALVAATSPAGACSNISVPVDDLVASADVIFVGEPVSSRQVEGAEPGDDTLAVTLTVREVLKGDVDIIQDVRVPGPESSCSNPFDGWEGTEVTAVAVERDPGTYHVVTSGGGLGPASAIRDAALAAGHEPHPPLGVPAQRDVVVGAGDPLAPGVDAPAVQDPVEDELVLIRGLAALVAVLLAIAIVSVLVRDDEA